MVEYVNATILDKDRLLLVKYGEFFALPGGVANRAETDIAYLTRILDELFPDMKLDSELINFGNYDYMKKGFNHVKSKIYVADILRGPKVSNGAPFRWVDWKYSDSVPYEVSHIMRDLKLHGYL